VGHGWERKKFVGKEKTNPIPKINNDLSYHLLDFQSQLCVGVRERNNRWPATDEWFHLVSWVSDNLGVMYSNSPGVSNPAQLQELRFPSNLFSASSLLLRPFYFFQRH
jgi:hypothetical protein